MVALLLVAANGEARAALGLRTFCCMVPMRDGTRLATDVYLPRFPRRAYPVVLVRTPDGKQEIKNIYARLICRRGWGLVVQDVRGRYGSQGRGSLLFHHDGWGQNRDGHDSIRWITRQRWCDGNVGTWGPSAMGFTQNLLAPGAPKALKAQHVMMGFSNMYAQAAYQGGVFREALVTGWMKTKRIGRHNLRAILEHPAYDEFWAELNAESQAYRVNVPAVFCGGWYDAFLQGTINSFATIHHHGGPRARGRCRLILGPWSHDDITRLVDPRHADQWPKAADPLRFFDYWLKGQCNGVPREAAVHYYVMGDRCHRCGPGNFWRAAHDWPPPAEHAKFYFHADGGLRGSAPEVAEGELSYRYDPCDPARTLGGQNLNLRKGPMDQRKVESRDDVLLFTTDALTEPVEVTGRIRATLYVSSDCPDTDFTVKLTDVYPDGRSLLLTDGILRARYRKSFEEEHFLEPGVVVPIEVDLWSTSIVFGRGHRIRVAVSSSNAPRFQPNPNTGLPQGGQTPPRVATNTLHLSQQHPSHIVLPLYAADGTDRPAKLVMKQFD